MDRRGVTVTINLTMYISVTVTTMIGYSSQENVSPLLDPDKIDANVDSIMVIESCVRQLLPCRKRPNLQSSGSSSPFSTNSGLLMYMVGRGEFRSTSYHLSKTM